MSRLYPEICLVWVWTPAICFVLFIYFGISELLFRLFGTCKAECVGSIVDERAAMKAKINSIWEGLKGKDSLPAKVGLPKLQKVSKPSKSSKAVPVSLVFKSSFQLTLKFMRAFFIPTSVHRCGKAFVIR